MGNFLYSTKPLILISDNSEARNPGRFLSSITRFYKKYPDLLAAVHVREFDIKDEGLLGFCMKVRKVTSELGVGLIVHDSIALAENVSADAVHIKFGSLDGATTKNRDILSGTSCHSILEIEKAHSLGCDYAYLSPIFPPISKSYDRVPLGIRVLEEARAGVQMKVIALGGISLENYRSVLTDKSDKAAGIGMGGKGFWSD